MGQIYSWLAVIAHNVALDALRRLGRHPALSLDAAAVEPIDDKDAERANGAEWSECLIAWLGRLRQDEPQNCQLVCARYLEGQTIRDLADQAGRTPHAISNCIYRTLQKLHFWALEDFPDGIDAS